MADTNGTYRVQYAALPYRVRQDGEVQLRLVTSRETRRWVIPKGWPMKGIPPHKAAAREAYEEAGLLGSIASAPLGIYRYDKRLSATRSVLCEVMVFPMKVKRYLKKWPERSQRVGFWFSIETAASVVQEPELASLILEFGTVMAERHAQKLTKQAAAAQAKAEADKPTRAAPKKKAVAKTQAAPTEPTAAAVEKTPSKRTLSKNRAPKKAAKEGVAKAGMLSAAADEVPGESAIVRTDVHSSSPQVVNKAKRAKAKPKAAAGDELALPTTLPGAGPHSANRPAKRPGKKAIPKPPTSKKRGAKKGPEPAIDE